MALENQILDRLVAITNTLNAIQSNSKRTEEFPHLEPLDNTGKIRVSVEGVSFWIAISEISSLIDALGFDVNNFGFDLANSTSGSSTTEEEIVDYINSIGFTVNTGNLIQLSIVVKKNDYFYVKKYNFRRNNISGNWGTSFENGEINISDLVETGEIFIGNVPSGGSDVLFNLGDIGNDNIFDYINNRNTTAEPYRNLLDDGSIYYFSAIINGDNQIYRYVGSLPKTIGQGQDTLVFSDFDLISNNAPVVNWSDIQGDQSSINLSGFNDDLDYATPADLELKVDKVTGKGLSDENYTLGEKQKLAGLEGSKWLGLYPNITALESAHPTALAGNYADVDAGVGVDTIRYVWDVSDDKFVQSGSGAALTPAQIKQMYESNPDTNVFTDDEKSKLASITAIFTTALKNAYDGAVTWISTNGQNLLDHLGLTDNPHSVTLDQVLEEDNVSARNATFGEVTATKFIDSDGTETLTGTVIDLSNNIDGTTYNYDAPSTATSFSVVNLKAGGYATNYIDTTGMTDFPDVTNASGAVIPSQRDAFREDATFEMVLETLNGVDVLVYFLDYLNLDPISGGSDKITVKPPLSTATYTLQNSDVNKVIVANNTATLITVNDDSITRIGDVIYIDYFGTGACQIVQGSTILLTNSNDTLFLDGQYSRVAVQKMSATQMRVFGQLIPA